MTDFNNGKIYSIRSHQTDQIYIGSTIQPLCKRLYGHRTRYRRYKNTGNCYNTYISSFEVLQYDDNYIELIEGYACENRQQLHRREGQIIRAHNCVNKRIEGRTIKEYRDDNKDKLSAKARQYYQKNKEQIFEYKKKYNAVNKDKINAKAKQYYQKNKEKKREKIACECGSIVRKYSLTEHKRSKKHQRWVEQNN
jgi:transcriptional regulator of heat shock response